MPSLGQVAVLIYPLEHLKQLRPVLLVRIQGPLRQRATNDLELSAPEVHSLAEHPTQQSHKDVTENGHGALLSAWLVSR